MKKRDLNTLKKIKGLLKEFAMSQPTDAENIEIFGEYLLSKFFVYNSDTKIILADTTKHAEVFNIAKVLAVGNKSTIGLKPNDIVSLQDDFLEPIPNPSKGYNQNGEPNAGFITFGKIKPYAYLAQKIDDSKFEYLFIIPESTIRIKHINIDNVL